MNAKSVNREYMRLDGKHRNAPHRRCPVCRQPVFTGQQQEHVSCVWLQLKQAKEKRRATNNR